MTHHHLPSPLLRARPASLALAASLFLVAGGCSPADESGSRPDAPLPSPAPDPAPAPGSDDPAKPIVKDRPSEPGEPVVLDPPKGAEELAAALLAAKEVTAEELLAAHDREYVTDLGYDPTSAQNFDLIDGSSFTLAPDQRATLKENGFVISTSQEFPTFGYGYKTIYAEDLPVFISADSVLFALHRSFTDILKRVEISTLTQTADAMLAKMHAGLAQAGAQGASAQAIDDMDFYLAVARSLLAGAPVAPLDASLQADVDKFLKKAMAANGMEEREVFGALRRVDFSQFKPRGHYTESPALENYFRAMMWIGRIDLRILEPNQAGEMLFHRRQFEAAGLMSELVANNAQEEWDTIEEILAAIMGDQDNMTIDQFAELAGALQIDDLGGYADADQALVADELQTGAYGAQRIASHIMINGPAAATLPLSASLMLIGQRYVFDSHVFSNVVFDRLLVEGKPKRMMPNPLDAAFATFGSPRALELLEPELQEYGYAGPLNQMAAMAEFQQAEWKESLYHGWLKSLRALDDADPESAPLPTVAKTEAWGSRLLNTQLASWAELRRDTILYAKQSYTGGAACEFPDAYVDPYPAFWAELGALAVQGQEIGRVAQDAVVEQYFERFGAITAMLEGIARAQQTGLPLNADQLAFINKAVTIEAHGCTAEDSTLVGWYGDLFFDPSYAGALEYSPTIADVHTQPTDEVGNPVGRVLHVGTNMARAMVVTIETCSGPRAYVGLASSYYEHTTGNFKRLNDEEWSTQIQANAPAEVDWMSPVLAP